MGNIDRVKGNIDISKSLQEREIRKHPWEKIKVTFIKENVYAVEWNSWNINYFLNSEGELIANPWAYIGLEDYQDKLSYLWYRDKKVWTEYVMHRLKDNSKVNKYSTEYFNIFSDIDFWEALKYMEIAQRYNLTENQALELIPGFTTSWAFRIKDLLSYLEKGQITQEDFTKYLPKLQKLLKSQCIDEWKKFERFWDPVTEEELKMYLEKWYIDKKTARELYEILKKKSEKKTQQQKIKNDTHSSLEGEKSTYLA